MLELKMDPKLPKWYVDLFKLVTVNRKVTNGTY